MTFRSRPQDARPLFGVTWGRGLWIPYDFENPWGKWENIDFYIEMLGFPHQKL
jgi:hypothetical protein